MLWIELHILSDIYGASKRRCQCPKVNIQSFIFKLVFSKLHISYKKSIIFVSCINFLTIYMCPYSICHPIAFITDFCTKKFVAQTKNFFLHSPKKFSTHIPFLSSSVFFTTLYIWDFSFSPFYLHTPQSYFSFYLSYSVSLSLTLRQVPFSTVFSLLLFYRYTFLLLSFLLTFHLHHTHSHTSNVHNLFS